MATLRRVDFHIHNKSGVGLGLTFREAFLEPDGTLYIQGDIFLDQTLPYTLDKRVEVTHEQGDSAAAK